MPRHALFVVFLIFISLNSCPSEEFTKIQGGEYSFRLTWKELRRMLGSPWSTGRRARRETKGTSYRRGFVS